jgi:hypothetical protein
VSEEHNRDPAAIFLFAEQYKHASNWLALSRRNGFEHEVRIPAVVCSAFALELFLKCLLVIEGRKSTGHDLRELFDSLSDDAKTRIRDRFAPRLPEAQQMIRESAAAAGVDAPHVDFDSILDLSKAAFVQTRYIYEGIAPGTGWAASGILDATRQVILDLKPAFAELELALGVAVIDSPAL